MAGRLRATTESTLRRRRNARPIRCMLWDPAAWETETYDWSRRMIALRRSSDALKEGGFQVLVARDETFWGRWVGKASTWIDRRGGQATSWGKLGQRREASTSRPVAT
jgi:hypothetical protein